MQEMSVSPIKMETGFALHLNNLLKATLVLNGYLDQYEQMFFIPA